MPICRPVATMDSRAWILARVPFADNIKNMPGIDLLGQEAKNTMVPSNTVACADATVPAVTADVEQIDTAVPSMVTKRRGLIGRRRGVTLTEGIIAISILAAAIAIVAWMGSLAMASFRSVQLGNEIQLLQDTINQTTQGTTDLGTLNSAAIAMSGALPTKYVPANGNTIVSPFGSLITISGNGVAGGTNRLTTFTIQVPQVPRSACVKSMTTDYGNTIVSRIPAGDGVNGGPSSAIAAAQACTSQTSNTITLEFIRS